MVIAQAHAALQHSVCNHAPGQGACEQRLHAHAAGALAEDRDVFGIPAEGVDVLTHPAQGCDLVQDAVVAADGGAALGPGLGTEEGMRQEAPGPQTVVDGDEDHAPAAIGRAVKLFLVAEASHKGAAVDP